MSEVALTGNEQLTLAALEACIIHQAGGKSLFSFQETSQNFQSSDLKCKHAHEK